MKISSKEYIDNQIQWLEKVMNAEIKADRDARGKALASMEKRLDGMNEFRTTLKDQAATFITRGQLWAAIITVITIGIAITALMINYFKSNG